LRLENIVRCVQQRLPPRWLASAIEDHDAVCVRIAAPMSRQHDGPKHIRSIAFFRLELAQMERPRDAIYRFADETVAIMKAFEDCE
jgi:hypothetical protein